jgi:hypothetical protein
VLEDIQAAQAPMLDLVEEMVREAQDIPLLVVCAARYALLDDRPDWGGGRGNSVNLYLETLSLDDSTQLARDAGEGLDESTAQRIAQHAGGNPFFIIETTGMLCRGHPADTGRHPRSCRRAAVAGTITSSQADLVRGPRCCPFVFTSAIDLIAVPTGDFDRSSRRSCSSTTRSP